MAIKKTTATKLRKAGRHYATIDPLVFATIGAPDAAAVWVYLMTCADGWIVRSTDIQKRFSIGRDRARNALRDLRDVNLVEDIYKRDSGGHIIGRELVVWSEPNTVGRENRQTVKPTVGKPVVITKDQLLTKDQLITKDQKNLLSSKPDDIIEIFEFWKITMQKPAAKLTAARRTKIKARLSDGYPVQQILDAIVGCTRSTWHMGANPQRKKYNDLELICRDGRNIEQFSEAPAIKESIRDVAARMNADRSIIDIDQSAGGGYLVQLDQPEEK